ncbi:MAG: hypothetical protein Q7S65_04585, partial [Nanoarchaeota archaeon]|nr:hypothetical protein [Nanoarchaeota archaeon]
MPPLLSTTENQARPCKNKKNWKSETAFIVVPKNSGLRAYRESALKLLGVDDSERIVEVRGEDVPFYVRQLAEIGKNAIGLTGEDLFREFCLEERE